MRVSDPSLHVCCLTLCSVVRASVSSATNFATHPAATAGAEGTCDRRPSPWRCVGGLACSVLLHSTAHTTQHQPHHTSVPCWPSADKCSRHLTWPVRWTQDRSSGCSTGREAASAATQRRPSEHPALRTPSLLRQNSIKPKSRPPLLKATMSSEVGTHRHLPSDCACHWSVAMAALLQILHVRAVRHLMHACITLGA
jgi:hypothetical protein